MRAKHIVKKIINSNQLTKKSARKAKAYLRNISADNSNREVYELSKYYPTIQDYYAQQNDIKSSDPLISILLPTYNTPEIYLRECIESIIVQSYPNWELCISDDNSTDAVVVSVIEEYMSKDKRIKLVRRKENGHISLATNSVLEIAKGPFVALMDHDDVLWPNALYEIAKVIRNDKGVDFIYTDEDKIDGSGKIHSYPFLKPDFSPEFLESCNYITHFSTIRKSVMDDIGGFRKGYEGAQDWDLFIRISEKTSRIHHIPKMLYSWRIHEASTASDTDAKPYVYEAQRKLLEDHVERMGRPGKVETGIIRQHRTIKYEAQGSITILINSHSPEATNKLIDSMKKNDPGMSVEVVVIGSSARNSIHHDFDLGYSKCDVSFADSSIAVSVKTSSVLMIDDSLVIDSNDWARVMLADSEAKGVGVVFPVILRATTDVIESAGIGIGYGDLGGVQMLKGFPLEDNHYSRGLYAKSRRNVSAGNMVCYAARKEVFEKLVVHDTNEAFVAAVVGLVEEGKRHIYTPYVRVRTSTSLHDVQVNQSEDKYLNHNFVHTSGSLEVV